MRRLTNILGLLFLIYFVYNYQSWDIGTNETNILSFAMVKTVKCIPNGIIVIMLIMLMILYIIEIIDNNKSFLLYVITIGMITIVTKMSLNILMLENISSFPFFYIEHPVPIELKLLHFRNTISIALESVPKENIQHILEKLYSDINTKELINNISADIKELNAVEITNYAQEFLNNIDKTVDSVTSKHLNIIAIILILSPSIPKIFHLLANYV